MTKKESLLVAIVCIGLFAITGCSDVQNNGITESVPSSETTDNTSSGGEADKTNRDVDTDDITVNATSPDITDNVPFGSDADNTDGGGETSDANELSAVADLRAS